MSESSTPLVEMRGISKRYPGVLALDRVDFELRAGEVHILAGENGAGKSTLMKVLAGSIVPDEGEIRLNGEPANFSSPIEAMRRGVAAVHQEYSLCPHLTVAENIFLGQEPGHALWIDRRAMREKAAAILERLHAKCRPDDVVAGLGTAQMQLVEIARALKGEFKVLILDEPTATLSESEIDEFFRVIRSLRESGHSIVYISHRLEEFAAIGDRVTVMRNGRVIETMAVRDATIPVLVNRMAGKDLAELFPQRERRPGAALLRVERLTQGRRLRDVSFELRAGEILGVAGLVGSGRTRLLRALFGLENDVGGRVVLDGREITHAPPRVRIAAGMGLVPEDRKTQGLMLGLSIARNISINNLDRVSVGPWVSARREAALAEGQRQATVMKAASVHAEAGTLSGGNQQKVVLAKWLASECRVLLLDEPARGVDVGARYEIFRLIARCAEAGMAVILVSSYLPEILGMADRVVVMWRGEVAAELDAAGATQEAIVHAASVGPAKGAAIG